MERYRILPHPADGKFLAFGRTREEAFANAALATASLMWDWAKIELRTSFPVQARGRDLEQLLVKFLGEVIYLLETRRFLLGRVSELTIINSKEGYTLSAFFWGDQLSDLYPIFGSVKAVTYNEMEILEGDGITIQVVVDM